MISVNPLPSGLFLSNIDWFYPYCWDMSLVQLFKACSLKKIVRSCNCFVTYLLGFYTTEIILSSLPTERIQTIFPLPFWKFFRNSEFSNDIVFISFTQNWDFATNSDFLIPIYFNNPMSYTLDFLNYRFF